MRKKITILLTGFLVLSFALTGCGDTTSPQTGENEPDTEAKTDKKDTTDNNTTSSSKTDASQEAANTKASSTKADELFTDRDFDTDYDENSCVKITFSDTDVQSDAASATVEGTTATITDEGSYLLSGACKDGMVIVDTDAKVQLILDGLDLCKDTSAALYVRSAGKVFVTLAEGSENSLSSTGEYIAIDDSNIDGTIFSKDDLTLNGSGSLTVSSESGHGIVGKDDLKVTGGTYNISTAKHGISANNSIRIADGSFCATTGKDALHTEGYLTVLGGNFTLNADDDAFHADGTLNIADGTIAIEKSYEGIEGQTINISGGDISLTSSDDGINAGSSLNLSGGDIQLTIGGDGLDSNGDLGMTGGTVTINGPTGRGDGMIDYETGQATISGGTLFAAGSMDMAQNFGTDSTQCSILLSTENQSSGTAVTLTDSAGKELLSWTPATDFSGVVISCPDLKVGESYTITAGSFTETITLENTIYGSGMGGRGGMGGKGGMPTPPENGTGDMPMPPEKDTGDTQTPSEDIFENEEGDSL